MAAHVRVEHILGNSTYAARLRQRIVEIAALPDNVLVSGPRSTGKGLAARAIHGHSLRGVRPLVPVHCATLSGRTSASQLFGHVRGAFAGAAYAALGCLRVAHTGVILLDEIGELDLAAQAQLVQVLRERQVTPVGTRETFPADVRVIATTSRDLIADVRSGTFRLDLYHLLNGVSLETLPLRERPRDILTLARHFLGLAAIEIDSPDIRMSWTAARLLRTYSWPGNVRQLRSVIERAVVFAEESVLGPENFPDVAESPTSAEYGDPRYSPLLRRSRYPVPTPLPPTDRGDTWPTLQDFERYQIRRMLAEVSYHDSPIARLLEIDRTPPV